MNITQDTVSTMNHTSEKPGLNILIIEDDYTSRTLMQHMLGKVGQYTVAQNGIHGLHAFTTALNSDAPYDLICLDIMMPEMNGYDVLRQIRALEQDRRIFPKNGVKIVMTTAIDNLSSVKTSYFELCDGYLTKPLDRKRLMEELVSLELIDAVPSVK